MKQTGGRLEHRAGAERLTLLLPTGPCSGRSEWMPSGLLIERFGRHVNAVWPCNRGGFWIDADLREIAGVPQWFENTSPLVRREVNVPNGAIIEKQAESVVPKDSDAHNCWKVRHMNILRKRRNREKALGPTSAVPVCQQFVSMEACPLANETESS